MQLWERGAKTYHVLVVVRLLRHAAGNVQKKQILDKVKAQFSKLDIRGAQESVDETMLWASRGDDRLSKLLKSMAKIKIKGYGAETIGAAMKAWSESQTP